MYIIVVYIRLRDHAAASLDRLVGGRKQRFRDGKAEGLGGLEVEHHFELGRRLHRQVGGLFALEDAIDVAGRAPELVDVISAIARRPR